jgi:hypothetical protein
MPPTFEIRADFDRDTIVIYQAFPEPIALAALEAGTFVPPFSFQRMTWIKPSFLWLMERSNWGQKSGQEHTLAVRITRAGFEEALSLAVLTHGERSAYPSHDEWRRAFEKALVHVQWDPERSVAGESLPHRSIQVGLSRHIVARYAKEWIREIRDLTPLVQKLRAAKGKAKQALLPKERPYPLPAEIGRRIGIVPASPRLQAGSSDP